MELSNLNFIFNCLYDSNTILTYDEDNCEVESIFFYSRCIQCAVFLIQELGEKINNYKFTLIKKGNVHSKELDADIIKTYLEKNENTNEIVLPQNTKYVINKLKEVFAENGDCTPVKWAELLATTCYLKHYVLTNKTSVEELCVELKKRNPGFDNEKQNKRAVETVINKLLF